MSTCPGLSFVETETHLMAVVTPSATRASLDEAVLRELLDEAGYAHWSPAAIDSASLMERYGDPASNCELPLAERCDGAFLIEVASDAMQAWIDVTPANGGQHLDLDAIVLALGEASVTFGIDQSAIKAACSAKSEERFLVASGQAAQNGENARFELLVADARDRAPKLNEHGLIDFRELGAIPTVSADEALMRRHPPTTGSIGRNVRGEVIEPGPGRDEPFADHLVGACVAKDDANLLRAIFAGQPVRCGNGVNVEQVLRLRNINMASGNISFDGTVSIDGEVLPGMKVHATGDIAVGGVVDGAELDAGGDIRVAGGIIAKARVRAAGSVSARFVEGAHVQAGTTILIDDTALQSELQANNQIVVGLKSPQRGRLAGGSARAMLLIKTPILGSPTGGVTSLLLGVNPVLEAEYQALLQRIAKQREEENNLEKLVKHLSTHGDKGSMLERAKNSWQEAIKAWARLLPERDELERQLAHIARAQIDVGVGVVGAVDASFGKKVVRLRKPYDKGCFSVVEERVVHTDPGGSLTPAG